MLRLFTFIILLFSCHICFCQQAEFKIYLVGDAGEDEMTGATLDSLKSKLLNNPQSVIVFMGDNSYKNMFFGLIPSYKGFDSSKVTQHKITSQLNILNAYKGSVFFVPGNHDWWNIAKFEKGKRKLKMEESFIEANLSQNPTIANPQATFFPKDGSPGPASVELYNKKVRIVFIDTYWLILLGFKSNLPQNFAIAAAFYHNLDSILNEATTKHQQVIIVAHHPVSRLGNAMGKPLKHPFLLARLKQSYQTFPSYDSMSRKINAIIQKYPNVYYASGHLHALQYFTIKNTHYIISGSGSKTIHVNASQDNTEQHTTGSFCELWDEKGFFEIDFYKDYTPGVIIYHDNGRETIDIQLPQKLE